MPHLHVFETYADLMHTMTAARMLARTCAVRCDDCGAVKVIPSTTPAGRASRTGGASGYATIGASTASPRIVCYDCADARQRADLLDRSRPFVGYLSGNGLQVTTWTGGHLARVTRSTPCRLTRASYTHDRHSYRSVHVVDVHGGHWHGRGSPGIAITLRPCKASR